MSERQTINFYDKESLSYSAKRYTVIPSSYYQYLFTRRLHLFLGFLKRIEPSLPAEATLLEVGCADGVVMKAIEAAFPGRFASMIGVDISPKMIDQARKSNENPRANFLMRNELEEHVFDVVVELGVLVPDVSFELDDARSRLGTKGYFFYCLPGKRSAHTFFKREMISQAEHFMTYEESDRLIESRFSIKVSTLYALFIPKLWAFPVIGRALQPVFDLVFQKIAPELFHEKIYLLRKKD